MDQYNDAVQHPQTAFSDAALKSGKVAANGLGIPIALGGGFAITYTVTSHGKKYAVRCFYKAANGLEARYAKIGRGLSGAGGPYFVGFEYQPSGILVNGNRYPIVRMDWVEGDTLGMFLETHYSDKTRLAKLRTDFHAIEKFLRQKTIAHGDLQNGNVIIGSGIRLIDYDGIFVPELARGQGNEIGHKHFQHPKRRASDFGPDMDRFSFIAIDVSLRALAERFSLFKKYSNGENILFTASDYVDPANSPVFAELRAIPGLDKDAENLARICGAPVGSVPTLEDFLAGRNIPAVVITIVRPVGAPTPAGPAAYIGAYDVLDAEDFDAVMRYVGDRIELIGLITDVRVDKTRHGKPYVFINFGNWRGRTTKINIWPEGLAKLSSHPDTSWVGKWVSVTGLVDAPYSNRRYRYTHLSITLTEANQLRKISAMEAKRRLGSPGIIASAPSSPTARNREILGTLPGGNGKSKSGKRGKVTAPAAPPKTTNQIILEGLQKTAHTQPSVPATGPTYKPSPPPVSRSGIPRWFWWVGFAALAAWLVFGKK